MKPNEVEFGERYSDDSGWERRLSINVRCDSVRIEAAGSAMTCSVSELEWIISAANAALVSVGIKEGANNE